MKLIAALLTLLPAALFAAEPPAVNFTWSVGTTETSYATQFGNANDECINLYWDTTTQKYHYISSYPYKQLYSGTTLETMAVQGDVVITGVPGSDARAWHTYLWRDSGGVWRAFIHVEYAYNQNGHDHLMKVGLAHSSDLLNWVYDGDILTVADPSSAGYSDGCGNPTFMEDDTYFYLLYDDIFNSDSNPKYGGYAIARAPKNNWGVGQWKKYHNGQWNSPGVGGAQTLILGNNINVSYCDAHVVWSDYLQRYLLLINDQTGSVTSRNYQYPSVKYALSTSTDLINWSTPVEFWWGGVGLPTWYQTFIGTDPATGRTSTVRIGQNAKFAYNGNYDGYIVRARDVTFTLNTPSSGLSVALTSPATGATVSAPASLLLTATAADSNGTVTRVEFYQGNTKLGEDTAAPYAYAWNAIVAGTYSLTARATDDSGNVLASTAVTLTVGTPSAGTLGNTADGTAEDFITDSTGAYINACRFQAASTLSLTGIRARVGAITGSYRCALYADNAGNPGALLRSTATLTNVAAGWREFTFTTPFTATAGTSYWLAIWSNDTAAIVKADPSGSVRYAAYAFGAWPDPVVLNGGTSQFTYAIYAYGQFVINQPPTVSAGSAQSVTLPATATLTGSAGDTDGPSTVVATWSLVSGPGSVTFGNAASAVTSAAFTIAGTYVLRLAASDGAVTTASTVTITVAAANAGFTTWIGGYALSADQRTATADPDGDGVNNLLEYALGGDPLQNDPGILPVVSSLNGSLQLTFLRARADLTYIVQGSADLATWEDLATNPGTVSTTTPVVFTDSVTSAPRRFIRLKVTSP